MTQFITGMGVFGGSNALWRTAALRDYQFRRDVQTEDIDLSTRALLGGRVHIRFEPRCRSGELPPSSLQALYRQRLRWALGWDQVTLQHMSSIWSAHIGCGQKLGLYYILPLRWGILVSATLNAMLTPAIGIWYFETTGGSLGLPIDLCMYLSVSAFVTCCGVVAVNMVLYEPMRRWPAVFAFQASGILYIGWQVLLVLVSLSKICTGQDSGWVVTTRQQVAKEGRGAKQRALSHERSTPPDPESGGGSEYPLGRRPPSPSPIQAAFGVVGPPAPAPLDVPDSPVMVRRPSSSPKKRTPSSKEHGDGRTDSFKMPMGQPWYASADMTLMA